MKTVMTVLLWPAYACSVVDWKMWAVPPHLDKLVVLVLLFLRVFTSDATAVNKEGACGDDSAVRLVRC
jgi:hypothetical protein